MFSGLFNSILYYIFPSNSSLVLLIKSITLFLFIIFLRVYINLNIEFTAAEANLILLSLVRFACISILKQKL
jgi:accessory gene regulator protein AgrB